MQMELDMFGPGVRATVETVVRKLRFKQDGAVSESVTYEAWLAWFSVLSGSWEGGR